MSYLGRIVGPLVLPFGAVTALLVAVACANGTTESAGEVQASGGKLVIYSGRSESLVDPIIRQFRDATGIDVQIKYAKTGALAATLLEEGSKTPADVFFAQDPGGLGAVKGMLSDLGENILTLVPEWARSPEGRWVGISGRSRVIVYNNERLTEADLPPSLDGFTKPEWQGRIGWAPTNGSFQAMITGMRILWGEEKTREWLEAIQANDPKVYPKNTPIVAATAAGEIDVGFVNHYYLHRFLAEQGESFSARNYYLGGDGPGSIVLVAGAGILETARNRAEAERFLEFLLGPIAQQYFASQTFEHPLVAGVQTNPGVPALDTLNKPEIDISDLGDLERTQALLREVGALP